MSAMDPQIDSSCTVSSKGSVFPQVSGSAFRTVSAASGSADRTPRIAHLRSVADGDSPQRLRYRALTLVRPPG
jgi:hypothetical protein